jgi:hypothetical protein
MKFYRKRWGWTLLFFALAALTLASCSGPDIEPSSPASEVLPQLTNAPDSPSPTPQPDLGADDNSNEAETSIEPATPTAPATAEVSDPMPVTEIPEPTTEPEPTLEPEPTKISIGINGMPADQFIIMSDEVRENIGEIYAKGQTLGRNPEVFAILGDSLIATSQSLAKWDGDDYVLGDYEFLQPTIDWYAGSFGRYGVSVRVGLHSWSVFDPLWADKDFCLANEDLLTCEMRLNNPSVMIIFLGSNDAGSPGGFDFTYRQIVETLINQGVVPILATKADRFEGPDNTNNKLIRNIAADFKIPLLEFDLLADTLPQRGLSSDNIHLTYSEPLDYTTPDMFTLGYPVHNLASLMILDEVRRELAD